MAIKIEKIKKIAVKHLDRLNQLKKIDHIHANQIFHRAIEMLESVGKEPQIHENGVRLIHGNHFDSRRINLEVCLG